MKIIIRYLEIYIYIQDLRDRLLNTEREGMEEKVGGSGIFFLMTWVGLEIHILLKGGVSNILPAKGHMSHDLGAVTIFRFLELELGLGLGLDLG